MKPETAFRTRKVLPFLKKLNQTAIFPIQQASIIGDPDYILCIRGQFVALELKGNKGTLDPVQEYKLSAIVASGGYGYVADPNNWDEVKNCLSLLSQGQFVPCRENYRLWVESKNKRGRK